MTMTMRAQCETDVEILQKALSSTSKTIREGLGAFIIPEKARARGEEASRQSPQPSSPRHNEGVFKVGTDLLDTLVLTSAALRAGIAGGQGVRNRVASRDRSAYLDDFLMMRLLLEQEGNEVRAGMTDSGLDYFRRAQGLGSGH